VIAYTAAAILYEYVAI